MEFKKPEARDLTVEEQREMDRIAAGLEEDVKASIRKGSTWETAEALYEFDLKQGWLRCGCATRREWLAGLEMRETQFRRLVRCYRELAVCRGLDAETYSQLDPAKVEVVLPALRDRWVVTAQVLRDVGSPSKRELREKYCSEPARNRHPLPIWAT